MCSASSTAKAGARRESRQVPDPGVRRRDIARLRCTYPDPAMAPREFEIAHVDLFYFFYLDVVVLTVEIQASDIPLDCAQETLFRLGRAYPIYWGAQWRRRALPEARRMAVGRGRGAGELDYELQARFLAHVQPVPCPDPGRALGFPA